MSISTAGEIFSTKLQNRWILLDAAADAVCLSFIVQNSISYLDLSLCEYSNVQNYCRTFRNSCSSEYLDRFISTQEKCRKALMPSRRLLYTLHLDLPTGREYPLKNDLCTCRLSQEFSIAHSTAKITLSSDFEEKVLSNFIKEALQVIDRKLMALEGSYKPPSLNYCSYSQQQQPIANRKLKLLEFLLKTRLLKDRFLFNLQNTRIVKSFIGCFYPDNTDSITFRRFIENFNLARYMVQNEEPKVLEYLLRHANHYGKNLKREGYSIYRVLDLCILYRFFLNIEPVLMYVNAPGFSPQAYDWYKNAVTSLRPDVTREIITKMETWMKPERIYLLLQMFWFLRNRSRRRYIIYFRSPEDRPFAAVAESLRLIWSSIPDPLISLKEVYDGFEGALCRVEREDLYCAYAVIVGGFHLHVRPRPLKHLSRTAVRKILWKNGHYLPEGIRNVGLPKRLQEYLNLGCDGDPFEKVNSDVYKMRHGIDY